MFPFQNVLLIWLVLFNQSSAADQKALLPGVIAVGGSHACHVQSDGGVNCWGGNHFGQLGPIIKEISANPLWTGITQITALAAGGDYT